MMSSTARAVVSTFCKPQCKTNNVWNETKKNKRCRLLNEWNIAAILQIFKLPTEKIKKSVALFCRFMMRERHTELRASNTSLFLFQCDETCQLSTATISTTLETKMTLVKSKIWRHTCIKKHQHSHSHTIIYHCSHKWKKKLFSYYSDLISYLWKHTNTKIREWLKLTLNTV